MRGRSGAASRHGRSRSPRGPQPGVGERLGGEGPGRIVRLTLLGACAAQARRTLRAEGIRVPAGRPGSGPRSAPRSGDSAARRRAVCGARRRAARGGVRRVAAGRVRATAPWAADEGGASLAQLVQATGRAAAAPFPAAHCATARRLAVSGPGRSGSASHSLRARRELETDAEAAAERRPDAEAAEAAAERREQSPRRPRRAGRAAGRRPAPWTGPGPSWAKPGPGLNVWAGPGWAESPGGPPPLQRRDSVRLAAEGLQSRPSRARETLPGLMQKGGF
jgi:hypothetical protein